MTNSSMVLRRFLLFLLLIPIVFVWLLVTKQLPYPSRPYEQLSVTVSPKWVNQTQFAGMFVAIEKGYYERYGLSVNIKEFSREGSPLADVVSGTSQFGLMSANDALVEYTRGQPIKAIAAFYQISPFVVISLAEENIVSPSDLRGRTIATKGGPGAETDSIYAILFRAGGIQKKDVVLRYLPFGTAEYDDLIAGKADAMGVYGVDQLYYFKKNSKSYNVLSPEQYGGAVYNDVLVATPEFLQKHPIAAKAFLRATIEGWEYAFAHPEEAVDITLEFVTNASYKDREHLLFILEHSKPLIKPVASGKIGSMDASRWNSYRDNLRSMGILSRDIAVEDFFTTEYLP